MTRESELIVELGDRSYPIRIGKGMLSRVGEVMRDAGLSGRAGLVTSPPLRALFGAAVEGSLRRAGFDILVAEVPDGEEAKTIETAGRLWDRFLAAGLERESPLVALGGGVVGDITGFVAATLKRGVPFVQVPTTLLSQVDSSVGGKVAVNHPAGKNLIGAFHQPRAVCIDPETLRTLPDRDLTAGVAEVIRYGAALDAGFFAFLEERVAGLVDRDADVLHRAVETSCAIKARIVSADERETTGERASLNYGHTFGHALEAVTGYGTWRHGEAVAIGMVWASRLAERLGICPPDDARRQVALIEAAGLPVSAGDVKPREIIEAMRHDKKIQGGKLRFILTEKLGRVNIYADIDRDVLVEILAGG